MKAMAVDVKIKQAERIAGLVGRERAANRIGLARRGFGILRSVPLVNGAREKAAVAAEKLAEALKKEYENPKTNMEAAEVAVKLKSFAMGIKPMVDTLCLS